jgi:hypothetical protein
MQAPPDRCCRPGDAPLHRETKLAQTFVSEPDILAAPERWPEFAERASQLVFRAVHGFPLRVREEALGALNAFLSETGPFSADDIAAVQALADVAAIGIAQERSVATGSGYEAALVGTMAVPVTNRSLSGCTLEAGATVVAADVTKDERFDGATRRRRPGAGLPALLHHQGRGEGHRPRAVGGLRGDRERRRAPRRAQRARGRDDVRPVRPDGRRAPSRRCRLPTRPSSQQDRTAGPAKMGLSPREQP